MTEAVLPRLVFERSSRLELEPYEAITASASPYLVKGLLPRRGVAFVVGAPRSGKTFLALDFALKVARGTPVMGRKARRAGVVYVAAEDPAGCRGRVQAWRHAHAEAATPFAMIGRAINLADPDEVGDLASALDEAAERFSASGIELGLVVIDTLSRCLPGADENAAEQMSLALQALEEVGRAAGALTLAVAHHGKDAARGIRGWSGLDAGSDATLTVTRDEETGRRSVALTKIKNGADGAVVDFALRPVPLGVFDEDGEELWSCVVDYLPDCRAAAQDRRPLTPGEEIVLRAVRQVVDHGSCVPPPAQAKGVRPGTLAVRRADVSRQAQATGLSYDGDGEGAYRQRFSRAVTGLAAKTRVRVHGDQLWIV